MGSAGASPRALPEPPRGHSPRAPLWTNCALDPSPRAFPDSLAEVYFELDRMGGRL